MSIFRVNKCECHKTENMYHWVKPQIVTFAFLCVQIVLSLNPIQDPEHKAGFPWGRSFLPENKGSNLRDNEFQASEIVALADSQRLLSNPGFLASLKYTSVNQETDLHFCTGVIVNLNTILTNGHCLYMGPNLRLYPDEIKVYVDTVELAPDTGLLYSVKSTIHPENFELTDPYTYEYNIGLLRLYEDLTLSKFVQTAVLGKIGAEMIQTEAYGWARDDASSRYENYATATSMLTIKIETCISIYGPNFVPKGRLFCAITSHKNERCKGGPLVRLSDSKVIGILSFVKGCNGDFPYVYVKVTAHRHWIKMYMEKEDWPQFA